MSLLSRAHEAVEHGLRHTPRVPSSHPPTLIKLVLASVRELELGGSRLLVAVSGGPDSMALLHVLARLRGRHGLSLFALGVDHGLRAAAASELDLVASLASELDVPFERAQVSVASGGNLQARARDARYAVLDARAAELGAWLCTAHHADDRAETVLLRLLRGAGPEGLAALPLRVGRRVRPMLRASRADVVRHIQRHELSVATDPSNADPRFLRVRVRHELLPLLRELSPNIVNHLTALADQLQEPAGSGEEHDPRLPPLNRVQIHRLQQALARGESVEIQLKAGRTARVELVDTKLMQE